MHGQTPPSAKLPLPARLAAYTLVGIAVFYLLTEHTQHVLGAVPYLRLLACPLLHFLMHGPPHHGGEST